MAVVASVAEPDRQHAIRLGGALAIATAALGAVQTVIHPPTSSARLLMIALVTLYGAVGLTASLRPRWIPDAVITLSVMGGTVAIAAGMLARGLPSVDRSDNEMLFLVPVVYGAYFFRRRWVLIIVMLSVACYGFVLSRLDAMNGGPRLLTTALALSVVAGVVDVLKARAAERFGAVQDQAVSDPLTDLANRRALEDVGPVALSLGRPTSLLLIDVDWFKVINDTFGHAVGDGVLVGVAKVLAGHAREAEMAVRLGGDEFVLLLPGRGPREATDIAERVRTEIRTATAALGTEATVSIGVAASEGAATLTDLLRAADTALYRAKRSGRNSVRFAWVDGLDNPAPDSATGSGTAARRTDQPGKRERERDAVGDLELARREPVMPG